MNEITIPTRNDLAKLCARKVAALRNEALDIHVQRVEAALSNGSFFPFQEDLHIYVREYLIARGF